jgi:hypothetical protein
MMVLLAALVYMTLMETISLVEVNQIDIWMMRSGLVVTCGTCGYSLLFMN